MVSRLLLDFINNISGLFYLINVFKAIRKQSAIFGLENYFNNKKLLFMSDRGSNIIEALEVKEFYFVWPPNKQHITAMFLSNST